MASPITINDETDALLVVDVQNDFSLPDGSLSVPDGESIIDGINRLSHNGGFCVQVATQDWHPSNHVSFMTHGGQWPVHCVHGSSGAALHERLDTKGFDLILRKGHEKGVECYSAFHDEVGKSTGLAPLLTARGVRRVFVCGLAWDYCVMATVMSAVKSGFETYVIADLSKAVFEDQRAVQQERMIDEGAHVVQLRDIQLATSQHTQQVVSSSS